MSGEGLRALAAFAAAADIAKLPPSVVEKAKACLLYAMAVGFACLRTKQAAQAVQAIGASAQSSAGGASRFFDDQTCDAAIAAFANSTLFHARVQDDSHPAGHVGVVVNPTALALAQAQSANGAELLAALCAGYEVALRIGRDHSTDLSARGFRSTPTYGVFGAAAAAGRLLGLDAGQMVHALALAANMPGGLREYSEVGSEDFAFQAGFAAQNGVLAARLAQAGSRSTPTSLDGAAGFFRAYGEPGRDYAARLALGLGQQFVMLEVTYKPYPVCQFHRGIVRGSIALSQRAAGATLATLCIYMHPFEANFFGVPYKGPFETFPQTFMSAPFCAALAWLRRDVTFAGLTDFRAADVLDLVKQIRLVADPARPRYKPLLEAQLEGGASLDWEEREGASAYVLDWQRACAMAQALGSEAGIGPGAVQALVAAVKGLEVAPNLAPLLAAMREVCAQSRRS